MESYAQAENGDLFIANGIDRLLRWDGLSDQAEDAGVDPPTTACTVSGTGAGSIVGEYYGYVRFLDAQGNPSNLSPVSALYTAAGTSGTITSVSQATPMVVTTSAAHGLTTGAVVKITGVGGATTANSTWEITVLSSTTFSLDGSVSATRSYTGGGTWTAGVASISYTNVPVPTQAKVTRKQILRNTDGQTDTFYVDVDTTNLSQTSFSSSNDDDVLSTNTAVPLLEDDGSPSANRYTVPPSHKCYVANMLGRLFLAGEEDYDTGSVSVTFGSSTVTGVATDWKSTFVGRFIYLADSDKSYEIATVNTEAQTLTLTEPYLGTTNAYLDYTIRPAPAEARLVYYSEPLLPQAWPATNALSLEHDSDDITGLCVSGSFLYILERNHIYRLTFQTDPAQDGAVFLASASRGCINNRCWVDMEDAVYMLDEHGIHAFRGRESESVSDAINSIFREEGVFTINWAASKYFHAVHYPRQDTVRWFVALSGHYLPRHALCYHHGLKRWWIEEYAVPVGASAQGYNELDQPVNYLGLDGKTIVQHGPWQLDGPDSGAGQTFGTVTSAGLVSLTDTSATFAASGLVGHPITIAEGTGKGQTRRIVSLSGTTITVDLPWLVLPDTTSKYQIGGVPWTYRSGWFRYATDDHKQDTRRVEVIYQTLATEGYMTMKVYRDRFRSPITWRTPYTLDAGNGVQSRNSSTDLVCDLTKDIGYIAKNMDGHRERLIDGARWMSLELSGCTHKQRVQVYEATIEGVE